MAEFQIMIADTNIYSHVVSRPMFEASGRRRRWFAALLDSTVMMLIAAAVAVPIFIATFSSVDSLFIEKPNGSVELAAGVEAKLARAFITVAVVWSVISAAYFVGCHAASGQTIGKRLLGIKVMDIHTAESPSLGTSALRYAVFAGPGWVANGLSLAGPPLSTLVFPVELVSLLVIGWILFESRRRGLHDLAAGTAVVRTRPPRGSAPQEYGAAAGW